jgi:hypothetical protein
MNDGPIRTFAQAMLSAWQAELQATPNPIIKEQCLQQAPDLLPRFAAQYQQLKALATGAAQLATAMEALVSRTCAAYHTGANASTRGHDQRRRNLHLC